MNLLTPDPGLLFWMVLSFLIVFFLLAKYGFPIIVDAINKRKEFIETSLVSAKEANERLATIKEEGEKLLAEAKTQQKEIISAAMQEKQKILLQHRTRHAVLLSRLWMMPWLALLPKRKRHCERFGVRLPHLPSILPKRF